MVCLTGDRAFDVKDQIAIHNFPDPPPEAHWGHTVHPWAPTVVVVSAWDSAVSPGCVQGAATVDLCALCAAGAVVPTRNGWCSYAEEGRAGPGRCSINRSTSTATEPPRRSSSYSYLLIPLLGLAILDYRDWFRTPDIPVTPAAEDETAAVTIPVGALP